MSNPLDLVMRVLHIFTAIAMVGGAAGGAFLGQPLAGAIARGSVITGIAAMFLSGLYNMMQVMSTAPKGWHMWFGIKFLLALHVFAMIFLMTKPDATAEKRARWQKSALIGTLFVVLAGVYLRSLRSI